MTEKGNISVQNPLKIERDITLPNNIEDVPLLNDFIDSVCEELTIDPAVTMSLNLAIEEAVVNVMQYAYPQGTAGDVQVIAKADDHQLTFTLIDAGIPFDPTAMKEADITLSAEERPIGGLGIHLVREIMDAVNYNRKDDKNILTLTKNIIS